jgi:hypothetical protein
VVSIDNITLMNAEQKIVPAPVQLVAKKKEKYILE